MTAPQRVNRDALLRYLIQFKTENNGDSPTFSEIMAALKISSKSVVRYNLHCLARDGAITLPGQKRSRRIGIVGGRWVYEGEQ